ncbi:MAG: class I SAM-dependent methyltransferase [Chloroflexi bacterium]|nr:class I SAM-dependent methyltransferase [Chloroflexota bacterium]
MSTAHGFHKMDDMERRKWQDPEAILDTIGLKSGLTFMDIGCGGGFFTLPAARLVGPGGKVYSVDTDAEALSSLKEKASKEGLNNLTLKESTAEETVFCQECADIVFFGIDLHDFKQPEKVLENARKMLKPSGRLVDLDWKKEVMPMGPPLWKRFSEEQASRLIESAGFKVESIAESGRFHYLIIAKP